MSLLVALDSQVEDLRLGVGWGRHRGVLVQDAPGDSWLAIACTGSGLSTFLTQRTDTPVGVAADLITKFQVPLKVRHRTDDPPLRMP